MVCERTSFVLIGKKGPDEEGWVELCFEFSDPDHLKFGEQIFLSLRESDSDDFEIGVESDMEIKSPVLC